MTNASEDTPVAAEQQRIVAEYRRREREIAGDLYAPWQPASAFREPGRSARRPACSGRCERSPLRETHASKLVTAPSAGSGS